MSIKKFLFLSVVVPLVFSACVQNQIPKEALKLNTSTLKDRQLQTRSYQTDNEMVILSAGLGVMQDLGFQIDETQKKLGVITGSKNRDAVEVGEQVVAVAIVLLFGVNMDTDKEQKIRASLVVTKSRVQDNTYNARVSFQRIIWGASGKIKKVETIRDKEIYEIFFIALDKATFLEGHKI